MHKRDAAILSSCLAIVVTCVVYVVKPPAPVYYPVEHVWSWEKIPGAPGMAWYGRSLWALGAGALTLLGALTVMQRLERPGSAPRWLSAAMTWVTLAAIVAALGDTVVHEYTTWIK